MSTPEGPPDVSSITTDAEWRVRGACELGINPYQSGKETDFRDDVRIVLGELNDARAALQRAERERREAEINAEMAAGCLAEIREVLEVAPCPCGKSHEGMPPMFYREWLIFILAGLRDSVAEREGQVAALRGYVESIRSCAHVVGCVDCQTRAELVLSQSAAAADAYVRRLTEPLEQRINNALLTATFGTPEPPADDMARNPSPETAWNWGYSAAMQDILRALAAQPAGAPPTPEQP